MKQKGLKIFIKIEFDMEIINKIQNEIKKKY